MPLLAHATMEPLNCTVHVTPTSASLDRERRSWRASQQSSPRLPGCRKRQVRCTTIYSAAASGDGSKSDMALTARANREARRGPGESRVDARRRHPPRHLPALLPRPDLGASLVDGKLAALEATRSPVRRPRALAAARLPERHRSRRRRLRGRHVHTTSPIIASSSPRRTARRHDGFLARRGSEQQRVRDRVLHGRAGAQGRQGSDRVPARACSTRRRACRRRSIW